MLRGWARRIRQDLAALYAAVRDPRTPWYVRWLGVAVIAYALSPLDLIPDFIPVVGYLDDLVLVPLGLWLVLWLIPHDVLEEHRALARADTSPPASRAGAFVVVTLWLVGAGVVLHLLIGSFRT